MRRRVRFELRTVVTSAMLALAPSMACKRSTTSDTVQKDPTTTASASTPNAPKPTPAPGDVKLSLSVPPRADFHMDTGGWVRIVTVASDGTIEARLVPGGFEDDQKRVTLAADGMATLHEKTGDDSTIRYEGLDAGDTCTAALLLYVIPVPTMP